MDIPACAHVHVRSSPREKLVRRSKIRIERWLCMDCGEPFVPQARLRELIEKYRMEDPDRAIAFEPEPEMKRPAEPT